MHKHTKSIGNGERSFFCNINVADQSVFNFLPFQPSLIEVTPETPNCNLFTFIKNIHSMPVDLSLLRTQIEEQSDFVKRLKNEMSTVIIGQTHLINSLIIAVLSNGHVLLEGMPGLAKTLTIKTLASFINCKFSRIQFTPDLLPADLIGTQIYNQRKEEFVVRKGPLFANIILADEINRAPAKVQSALLEAMQEKQVTIGEETFLLEEPFLVMATQNPIDQEGTYSLPEAQVDRFLLKIIIGYPEKQEEVQILRQPFQEKANSVPAYINASDILNARKLVNAIYLDENIEKYIIDLIFATRFPAEYNLPKLENVISYGASPRASLGLAIAARAVAFMNRRHYVTPSDVQQVVYDVLRHRIGISFEGQAENYTTENIIEQLVKIIPVP